VEGVLRVQFEVPVWIAVIKHCCIVLASLLFFKLNYLYQTHYIHCLTTDCPLQHDSSYITWAYLEFSLFLGYFICSMIYLAFYWLWHAFCRK
jgi:hypothetical protein